MKWMESLCRLLGPSEDIFIHPSDTEDFSRNKSESMATDAAMHAIADEYNVPKLAMEARKSYLQAETRLTEDRALHRSLDDFLNSVKIVYQTTTDTYRRLRDIALFVVQGRLNTLRLSVTEHDDDEEDGLLRGFLTSAPRYALELLTTDLQSTHVVCNKCQGTSFPEPHLCDCGMRGICGDKDCAAGNWTNVTCTFC